MTTNKKWYWIAGSIALIIGGFFLRKKGMNLWNRAVHHAEM